MMSEGKTIGQLMEEMRAKAGAQNYHGHGYMDLQRFAEDTRHMIIFDVLTNDSPVGWKGERTRLFLSDTGYEKALDSQESRDAPVVPHGKQTVKQLVGQNQGISNIEITDPSIKEFEKIARKYGVDYAVKKDRSSSPPKYLIFFKGRDADALTAAFTEYTNKKVKKATKTERPSVLAKLNQFKEMVKNAVVDRTKRKELER